VSLKDVESWLKRGQKVPFLREICSPKKCTPKIDANIGAITGILLRITCEELGHKQPATPMRTDNNTAEGIMNGTIKQNRSKAIDMRFYWLKDRVEQGQFRIYWEPGHTNLADYYTKHHPPSHHKSVRPVYMYTCIQNNLQ
jgi:hypothetical protein